MEYTQSFNMFNVLLLFVLLYMDYADTLSSFKMTSISCKAVDESFYKVDYCFLKAINRNTTETSVRIKILQPPLNDIQMHVIVTRRQFEHLPLIDYNIETCTFFRSKRRKAIAIVLYNLLGFEKYTNMNHTCPYEADLVMDKYKFEAGYMQYIPVPVGYYKLQSMWSTSGKLRMNISFNFRVY